MDAVNNGIVATGDVFWSYLLIPLLVVVSVYFTVRSGAVQLRLLPEMFRVLGNPAETAPDGKKAISSFQAFAISAAARVGTGNIVGVATAIALGGPGAVFWMWTMALVVGAASFVESTLAQLYKVRDRTGFRGGPAYYMQYGLRSRWMGVLFAVVITLTFGFVFNTVQANSIADAITSSVEAVGVQSTGPMLSAVIGLALALVTGLVVFGGVRRIAHVAQALVPFMALLYILLGLVVVAMNIQEVPGVVAQIVGSAFGLGEIVAGGIGTAIMQGMRRGMFSNEAGLGSAPNAGATASVSHPVKQGLVQTLGVYFDTLIVCSTTAFIVLLSDPVYGENRGPSMTQEALEANLGGWSIHALTVILFLLAFTSVLGNYYYGESNLGFLSASPGVLTGYRALVCLMVFLGAIGSVQVVWSLADLTMGIMALINLVAIAPLGGIAFRLLKDYTRQRRAGAEPVFTRDRMPDIGGVQCWDPEPAREEAETTRG
ncbi:alanine/glycine:cation symporter family protein [Marinitenerispora sediminis]|uniref:Sodium:alanine symporter family protein n=1 Tax=Marinitenerispora sediminis TaxID=1931232 RepID=A0A368SYC0_9ACTN|nr:alanine/glycine:cation symporter family protein [Marinitenerispora sediminis]RCV47420.1 sodium:alanine symporter family protein [Marinitenerispora sediminis]RCV47784.1 sodium:alanine symporter family protein [Marinitenerispora sediminis]RCV48869.1 sodium:alanine symporter family protein [Marinitenerispora sediminis]